MGYRSEVVIALKTIHVIGKLVKPNVHIDFMHKFADQNYTVDDATFFIFEEIKWYSNEINNYLGTLPDEDYGFARIGEEYSDIETQGDCWEFGIDIHRDIDYPPNTGEQE